MKVGDKLPGPGWQGPICQGEKQAIGVHAQLCTHPVPFSIITQPTPRAQPCSFMLQCCTHIVPPSTIKIPTPCSQPHPFRDAHNHRHHYYFMPQHHRHQPWRPAAEVLQRGTPHRQLSIQACALLHCHPSQPVHTASSPSATQHPSLPAKHPFMPLHCMRSEPCSTATHPIDPSQQASPPAEHLSVQLRRSLRKRVPTPPF